MKKDKKKMEARDRRGLTFKCIFDAIPMHNFIVPILHCVDLFMNSIKDLFDAFIDHRVENRPKEILEKRWKEADKRHEEREMSARTPAHNSHVRTPVNRREWR